MTDDGGLTAAVTGGAITVAGAAIIFAIERIVSGSSAYRDRRGQAFNELVTEATDFVEVAESTYKVPSTARLLATHFRTSLALGPEERAFSFWVSGMLRRLALAASMPSTNSAERAARSTQLQLVLGAFANTLIDRHQGKLTRHDVFMAGGLFWAETQGVDIDKEFPDEIERAMRPRPLGKMAAVRASVVQDAIIRPFLRLATWLGFIAPFGWVPEPMKEAAAKTSAASKTTV